MILFQSIQPNNFHFINPAHFPKEAYICIPPFLIAPFTTTSSFSPRQKTGDAIATIFRIAKEPVVCVILKQQDNNTQNGRRLRSFAIGETTEERSATVRRIVPVNCSRQIRARLRLINETAHLSLSLLPLFLSSISPRNIRQILHRFQRQPWRFSFNSASSPRSRGT